MTMNKTGLRLFLCLFVALMVAACSSTKKVAVTSRNAPSIQLPENSTIAIVNSVASEKSSQVYVETDFLYEGAARDGSNAVCDAIVNVFEKKSQLKLLPVVYAGSNENIHHEPVSMSSSEAEMQCKELGCNILIVVDYFFAEFQKDVDESGEVDASGTSVFKANLIGRMETSVSIFLRDSIGVISQMEPIHKEENITISTTGLTKKEAKSALPSKRTIVTDWGSKFGNNIGNQFIPNTYNVKRLFFVAGNSEFKNAWKSIRKGQYADSKTILEKISNSSNVDLKAMAYFNLAVVAECEGNLALAIKLLEQSLAAKAIPDAYSYKADLEYLSR